MEVRVTIRKLLFFVGITWALPMSLIGLKAGLLSMLLGSRLRYSDHALQFSFRARRCHHIRKRDSKHAKDLDAVVTTYQCRADDNHNHNRNRNDYIRIGDHERAHVYQYMVLGMFFLPIYFICGGISVKKPHGACSRPICHDG